MGKYNGEIIHKDLLFYDIECFKEDSIVIFKDYNKKIIASFHNDFTGMHEVIKDKILVGYNNYYYDDIMISKMINLYTPYQLKKVNDDIIYGNVKYYKDADINSLDVFQQISLSFSSLKKIEGNLGKSIIESSVPFDIDRKLTEDELEDTFKYCCYDIDMTIDIFKMREDKYFKTKTYLSKMLNKKDSYRWNTTTLSANILTDKKYPKWSTIRVPEELFNLVPAEVLEMWELFNKDIRGNKPIKSVTINNFNNEIVFGFGGLHGTNINGRVFKNVKLLDVASMYPHLIIALNVLGPNTKKYINILTERLLIKHTDLSRSEALKLVLNSVYGLLNNKYSSLFNPKALASVVIYGQILIYDLACRLSTISDIIQINTDGVMFNTDDSRYNDIWHTWENEYNLVLELSTFKKVIQKDVNNYIAVYEDDYIIAKGGEVGRYSKPRYFDNNNTRIIDIAITENLLYGKDIIDCIMENLDKPELFQYILKGGSTFYNGAFDQYGNEYQKVNRIFATKENGIRLYKKRLKDEGLVLYPDTPENMFLYNGDLKDFKEFKDVVDLNFYYNLIKRKLDSWK